MKTRMLFAILACLLGTTAIASTDASDQRGIWRKWDTSAAVVLARCEATATDGVVNCTVVRTFKGKLGDTLRLELVPTYLAGRVATEKNSLWLILTRPADQPPAITIYGTSGFMAVPGDKVAALTRYVEARVRLDQVTNAEARNAAYWQALPEWLSETDPFIREHVIRDLPGARSPWGGRIPDLATAASIALESNDRVVRSRFRQMVIRGTRDNPSDHNQSQVARLLKEDPEFAVTRLRDYESHRFPRDQIVVAAIRELAFAQDGDPKVAIAARRTLEALGE